MKIYPFYNIKNFLSQNGETMEGIRKKLYIKTKEKVRYRIWVKITRRVNYTAIREIVQDINGRIFTQTILNFHENLQK